MFNIFSLSADSFQILSFSIELDEAIYEYWDGKLGDILCYFQIYFKISEIVTKLIEKHFHRDMSLLEIAGS